jgi:hypothetical protein
VEADKTETAAVKIEQREKSAKAEDFLASLEEANEITPPDLPSAGSAKSKG